MSEFTGQVITAFVSGLFSLAAASIPIYMQRKESTATTIKHYAEGRYGGHPLAIGAFACLSCLFWSAVFTLMVTILGGIGLALGPNSNDDNSYTIVRDEEIQRISWEEYYKMALEKTYTIEALMLAGDALFIIPAFLIGRYVGRRADRFGVSTLVAAFLVAGLVVEITNRMSETSKYLKYNFWVTLIILHLTAALIGFYWAKARKGEYLIAKIYKRMSLGDRAALLDLAKEVVRSDPKVAEPSA